MNAIAFPVSIPEPPPTAITPSCLFSLNALTPSSTFLPVGFDLTSLKTIACLSKQSFNLLIMFVFKIPLSVTINGF